MRAKTSYTVKTSNDRHHMTDSTYCVYSSTCTANEMVQLRSDQLQYLLRTRGRCEKRGQCCQDWLAECVQWIVTSAYSIRSTSIGMMFQCRHNFFVTVFWLDIFTELCKLIQLRTCTHSNQLLGINRRPAQTHLFYTFTGALKSTPDKPQAVTNTSLTPSGSHADFSDSKSGVQAVTLCHPLRKESEQSLLFLGKARKLMMGTSKARDGCNLFLLSFIRFSAHTMVVPDVSCQKSVF